MSTEEERHERYENLLFGVRRSVRYHLYRRRHYEWLNNLAAFVSLLFGLATIIAFGTELAASWSIEAKLAPAVFVTVVYSWVLVSGVVAKAWHHADLARRFIDLERMLEAGRLNQTDELLEKAVDERLAIESDEPPVYHTLNTICHNEMVRAMGYGSGERAPVGFLRKRFAQYRISDWFAMPEKEQDATS